VLVLVVVVELYKKDGRGCPSLWLRVISVAPTPTPDFRAPVPSFHRSLSVQAALASLGAHAASAFFLHRAFLSSILLFATTNNDDNIPSGPLTDSSKETDYLTY
jgi:hypothetical protein